MRLGTRRYTLEREIALPRRQLWEILGNTNYFNREIGLGPIEFSPVPGDGTELARTVSMRYLGFTVRWREYPFQWVKAEYYSVLRQYDAGPVRSLVGGLEMSDAPTVLPDGSHATHLKAFAEITPANAVGTLLVPFVAQRSLRKTLDYCDRFVTLWQRGQDLALAQSGGRGQVNENQLQGLLKALARQPVERKYVPLLGAYLRDARDDEVAGLRPFQLAKQWDADRDEVLRLCLYATKVGLLNLSWKVMCPNCRVAKVETTSLRQIEDQFHCDLCGVNYSPNFDRYIELRFAVHPTVRQAMDQVYCIGSPTRTPHILVQQQVASGGEATVLYPLATDELRVRVLRANHTVALVQSSDSAAPATPELAYGSDGWTQEQMPAPPPGTPLVMRNRSDQDIVVVIEKVQWDEDAVTAAKVTTMQEFRDMFSSEVLAPGSSVSIENLTLFFSDLRDSTVLYETVGDAPAYSRVRNHFDFMFRIIAEHSGGVVKTIGDAVMAAFYSPEDAVRASLEIQREVQQFNQSLPPGEGIVIKIGLHYGPAIAINSNDRLDYFGRTVNIAARIQGASKGDDIVMSGECFQRPAVREILRDASATVDRFQTNLKGIEGVFDLYRVGFGADLAVSGEAEKLKA